MAQSTFCSSTSMALLNSSALRPSLPARAHLLSRTREEYQSPMRVGTHLVVSKVSNRRRHVCKATPVSVRSEQSVKGNNGPNVWLGRLAMVGFATAISIEIATGKGLLENLGFTTPLPAVALAVTGLVGVLTAFFIFQSASRT